MYLVEFCIFPLCTYHFKIGQFSKYQFEGKFCVFPLYTQILIHHLCSAKIVQKSEHNISGAYFSSVFSTCNYVNVLVVQVHCVFV